MSNQYYTPTGNPAPQSRGSSALIEQEFTAIALGFNTLPAPAVLAGDQQNYVLDTGLVNMLIVALPSNITGYTDGMKITVKPAYTNTGAVTLALGSLVPVAVVRADGTPLQAGDYLGGEIIEMRYSASYAAFQLMTIAPAAVATASTASAAAVAAAAISQNSAFAQAMACQAFLNQ